LCWTRARLCVAFRLEATKRNSGWGNCGVFGFGGLVCVPRQCNPFDRLCANCRFVPQVNALVASHSLLFLISCAIRTVPSEHYGRIPGKKHAGAGFRHTSCIFVSWSSALKCLLFLSLCIPLSTSTSTFTSISILLYFYFFKYSLLCSALLYSMLFCFALPLPLPLPLLLPFILPLLLSLLLPLLFPLLPFLLHPLLPLLLPLLYLYFYSTFTSNLTSAFTSASTSTLPLRPGPVCCPEVYRDGPSKFHDDDDD
jgi:hypothetical protein